MPASEGTEPLITIVPLSPDCVRETNPSEGLIANVGAPVQALVFVTEKGIDKGSSIPIFTILLAGMPALKAIDVTVQVMVAVKFFVTQGVPE